MNRLSFTSFFCNTLTSSLQVYHLELTLTQGLLQLIKRSYDQLDEGITPSTRWTEDDVLI